MLQGYLDTCAIAYINDIIVYNNPLFKHKKFIGLLLDKMQEVEP